MVRIRESEGEARAREVVCYGNDEHSVPVVSNPNIYTPDMWSSMQCAAASTRFVP